MDARSLRHGLVATALAALAWAPGAWAQDTTPPNIVSVDTLDANTVRCTFNEDMDPVTTETSTNYAIDLGITVSTATLQSDQRTVLLAVSTMPLFTQMILTVNNVEDLAGNPTTPNNARAFFWMGRVTVSFQDGLLPDPSYNGTIDAWIGADLPVTNNGGADPLQADGDNPLASGKDEFALIRWDLSAIPPDATVDHVTMTVNIVDPTVINFDIFHVKRPWTEFGVTWNTIDGVIPWETAGAQGGTDIGNIFMGAIDALFGGLYTLNFTTLGDALVQDWIDGTTPNRGIIIRNPVHPDGVWFSSRENPSPAARPKLTVSYFVAGAVPVCGDGTQQLGECCDDGNTTPGDGCDGICQCEGGCATVATSESAPVTPSVALVAFAGVIGAVALVARRRRRAPRDRW